MKATPIKLQRLLQLLFAQQAREVASKVSLDRDPPDMGHWVDVTADAVRPLLLDMWQQGMVTAGERIARKTRRKGWVNKSRSRLVLTAATVEKAPRKTEDLAVDFDLFNPKVLTAVDRATYNFCQETMDTATGDLKTSLDNLRQLMAQGLPRGDAIQSLARDIRRIFADPYRAFRIATTETSRAIHSGGRLLSEEVGVTSWNWLASSDACDDCSALNGKTVKQGEPYTITSGKPPYNVVYHPPLHPFCFCSETENID